MKTLQIALILSFAIVPLFAITFAQENPIPPGKKPTFPIGPETTYLTKPLHPEGGIDYGLAIEQAFHQNVKLEDNAAIPLMQAFGPTVILPENRAEFYRKLGMKPLSDMGTYFVSIVEFAGMQGFQATELRDAASEILYEDKETEITPPLLDWLKINQIPLDHIVEASKKTEFSSPLFDADAHEQFLLLGIGFPLCARSRAASEALLLRACLKIRQKDFDAAWEDILACHNLARLMEKKPFFLPQLFAAAIDGGTHHILGVFLNASPKNNPHAGKRLKTFLNRPFRADYMTKLEVERLMLLDAARQTATGKLFALKSVDHSLKERLNDAALAVFFQTLDWKLIFREANLFWNEVDAIHQRLPSFTAMNELIALNQTMKDWREDPLLPKAGSTKSLLENLSILREDTSKKFAKKIITLSSINFLRSYSSYRRQQIRYDMSCLMLALEAFHATEQHFPNKLNDLIPTYLDEIPSSPYLTQAYRYYPNSNEGYRLSTHREDLALPNLEPDLPTEVVYLRKRVPNTHSNQPANPAADAGEQPTPNPNQQDFMIPAFVALAVFAVVLSLWYWRKKDRQ